MSWTAWVALGALAFSVTEAPAAARWKKVVLWHAGYCSGCPGLLGVDGARLYAQGGPKRVRRSLDGGRTWEKLETVRRDTPAGRGFHFDRDLVLTGQTVHVIMDLLGGPLTEVGYSRSPDVGESWTPAVRLSRKFPSANKEAYYGRIAGEGDLLFALWEQCKKSPFGDCQLVGRASHDGGRTWERRTRLRPEYGEVAVSAGVVHLAKQRPRLGIAHRRSLDGGISFGKPVVVGELGLEFDIAAAGANVAIAWSAPWPTPTGLSHIFVATSTDAGASWSPPRLVRETSRYSTTPKVAISRDALAVAWVERDEIDAGDAHDRLAYAQSFNLGEDWTGFRTFPMGDWIDWGLDLALAIDQGAVHLLGFRGGQGTGKVFVYRTRPLR